VRHHPRRQWVGTVWKYLAPLVLIFVPAVSPAQQPGGTITGVVRDPTGGVVLGAQLEALNHATNHVRRTVTGEQGEYSFPALLPGEYEVSVDAAGFQRNVRLALVETGSTTRADFVLRLLNISDSITVVAASPQMHYDSVSVSGVITDEQIQGLPLNGRHVLELAKLEPGVQSPTLANRNRTVVPVLGAPASNIGRARFTVDGGSVTSVGLGGAQMTLSQEVVREFQVSTVNYRAAKTPPSTSRSIRLVPQPPSRALGPSHCRSLPPVAQYSLRSHGNVVMKRPSLRRAPR
jgi:hypothetical protein